MRRRDTWRGRPEGRRRRLLRHAVAGAMAGLMALCSLGAAHDKMVAAADTAHPATGRLDPKLDAAVTHIKSEGTPAGRAALAVHVTPAGHWQLANARDDVMTVAGPEEMRRAIALLRPRGEDDAPKSGQGADVAPLTLLMTDEAAGRGMTGTDEFPEEAQVSMLAGTKVYRLLRTPISGKSGAGPSRRWLARVRPHLLLEVAEPDGLRDTLWLLDRRLEPGKVRLLSLEPGAPRTLPPLPKREPGGVGVLPDSIDPAALVQALPALSRQKVLLVGRIDVDHLWFQPRSGPEQAVALAQIHAVAAAADIALVILDSRLTRQPGERTWAYLRVSIPGLEQGMQGATIGDFHNALAAAQGTLVLRSGASTTARMRLDATPFKSPWGQFLPRSDGVSDGQAGTARGVGGILQDVVSGLTGNVVTSSVRMDLPSPARQSEIERRWLPGLPSSLQMGYALLIAIGAAGWPVAARWWQRLWPVEDTTEYGSVSGYWAARSVRALVFLLVFLPVAAVAAFPVQIVQGLADTVRMVSRRARGLERRRTPNPNDA